VVKNSAESSRNAVSSPYCLARVLTQSHISDSLSKGSPRPVRLAPEFPPQWSKDGSKWLMISSRFFENSPALRRARSRWSEELLKLPEVDQRDFEAGPLLPTAGSLRHQTLPRPAPWVLHHRCGSGASCCERAIGARYDRDVEGSCFWDCCSQRLI